LIMGGRALLFHARLRIWLAWGRMLLEPVVGVE